MLKIFLKWVGCIFYFSSNHYTLCSFLCLLREVFDNEIASSYIDLRKSVSMFRAVKKSVFQMYLPF